MSGNLSARRGRRRQSPFEQLRLADYATGDED